MDDGILIDLDTKKKLIFPELLGLKPSQREVTETHVEATAVDETYGDNFDVRQLMAAAKDPLTGTLRDLKIDDRELATAKNFYDWCFKVSGSKERPWSRQLWVMLKLFNELCPRCNRPEMFSDIMSIDKNMDSEELGSRLAILEYGVCPGCGARKSELVRSRELNLYDELVLVWGQRCVTGNTLVLTSSGLRYFADLATGKPFGFSPYRGIFHNSKTSESASQFYVAPRKEHVYKITTSQGSVIRGTPDHPLYTPYGFKRLENLNPGDFVAEIIGTNQWGNEIPSYDLAYAKALTVPATVKTDIKSTSGTVRKSWFTLLGLWVARGRGSRIYNYDTEAREFCKITLEEHFSRRYVHERPTYYSISGGRGTAFLEHFVGPLFSGSLDKHVPPVVMAAPRAYVCSFLRGLFEGGGGINGKSVSYYTISPKLAIEVQVILKNLGIAAQLSRGWGRATKGTVKQKPRRTYAVHFSGPCLRIFEEHVGFISKRKQKLLRKLSTFQNKRTNNVPFKKDKLPPSILGEVLALVRDATVAVPELPYPQTLNGLAGDLEFSSKKRFGSFGPRALLRLRPGYWKDDYRGIGFRVKKLRKSRKFLTKESLASILDHLEIHKASLPSSLLHKINWLREFTDPNVVWSKITKKTLSSRVYQTYDVTLPGTHRFVANGFLNHNSGKSTTGVGGASYQLHRFLKFPMFGTLVPTMSTATPLTAAFVSLTFGKAFKVLWQPFRSLVAATPWYTELFRLLDFYGNQYGEELYFRRKEFVQFVHKNIAVAPTSPAWDVLRGDTRFMGIVDELGLFRLPDDTHDEEDGSEDSSKRANADEAHKSLDNSLVTVRTAAEQLLLDKGMDAVPTGVLMGVSSPTSLRDKVMRLLAETKTDIGGAHMLGSQLPTWEVNPSINRNSQVILNAYAKNPAKAERDFGANPVANASSYLSAASVAPMFLKYKSSHVLQLVRGPNKDIWAIAKQVRPVEAPTIIVLDAGFVNNSFAITCFSLINGLVRTECVCELMPVEDRRINFNQLYLNAIRPIAQDNFSVVMAADQWQSLDTLSRFVADSKYKKAKAKRFSLKRKHFDAVRLQIEDQGLVLPKPELDIEPLLDHPDDVNNYRTFFYNKPVAHLAHQFITIRDVGAQSCPEKGIGWTDDIARSWFLGAYLMQDQNVRKILAEAQKVMPKQNAGHSTVGIFTTRRPF